METRLRKIREGIKEEGVDVLLLQHADEYQSGHVHESRQRIKWLCGFTGSHAVLVISKEGKSKFFTDSRYTIQAGLEIDETLYDIYDISEISPMSWLEQNLSPSAVVGYYGELFTLGQISKYNKFNLKMLSCSLFDALWLHESFWNFVNNSDYCA